MRYYVTADVHGYFSELKTALIENGFFDDKAPHKLIVCGDLFDRGKEAFRLQEFILIKGNHEDLALELLNNWHKDSFLQYHHHINGTIDTVCQLVDAVASDLHSDSEAIGKAFLQNPYIQKIIPAMVD